MEKRKRVRKVVTSNLPEGTPGHRTPTQRKLDLAEIIHLARRGWSQDRIAEKLGLSQPLVCRELKAVYAKMAEQQKMDTEVLIQQKLDRLGYICTEALDAWDKSKEDKEGEVEEETTSDLRGNSTKTRRTKEGRLPDPSYLNIATDCIKQESNLQALNPAKEVTIKGHLAVWDVLAGVPGAVDGEAKRLTVEEEMEQLLRGRMIEGKVESVKETISPLDSPGLGTGQRNSSD